MLAALPSLMRHPLQGAVMSRLSAVALVLAASLALAGEKEGVKMPDTVTVEGKTLQLNGMGLRSKFIFKVYVAGLYLQTKGGSAQDIIARDEIRRVDMFMLRDLGKNSITEAIEAGVEKNSKADLPKLKDRLAKLNALIGPMKNGQTFRILYVPGKGTSISGNDTVIPGKDFADAIFNVWLGKSPVDDDLKKGMLGGK